MQLATFAEGGRIALVGGAVRDALLGHTPLDLDVVVEGTPVLKVAEKTGLPLTFHPAFQNATLSLPDGRSADLVQARRETYPEPGTNPVPHPGTLADDLRRRDFSLNALALLVRPDSEPAFLDEVSGLRDLEVRQLRPLHGASLHEDASRLVRGARLAARLDLDASPQLLQQVPDARRMAPHTPRLWAELKLLLQEPRPGRAAQKLQQWGAADLLPGLNVLEALDSLQESGLQVPWLVYAAAVLSASDEPAALAARLGLGERPGALLARARSDTYYPEDTPEVILRRLLRPDSYPPLTGRDVVALGVAPGKAVGEALSHLAQLRQAGQVRSADEERAALQRYLAAR
ncbi:tRNA nucleotidyltransferase [Deinococcus malanensis]|uniref:tRNA nucleotidyltransferase n=2 Tax=Deinococcus malanensis TaxID=1706855 RepID=A0ABQ2EIK6_9DEIO|nr:tRNA nucleotidyltransferase [Deinococcus malanensis]